MTNPWDRLPDEREPWWTRFNDWLRAGPSRSLTALSNGAAGRVDKNKKGPRTSPSGAWVRAAERWRWRERAAAWDREQEQRAMEVYHAERDEMLRRHANYAQAWVTRAMEWLAANKIGPEDGTLALAAFKAAVEVERKARGLPDWLVKVAAMSDDEVEAEYARIRTADTDDTPAPPNAKRPIDS